MTAWRVRLQPEGSDCSLGLRLQPGGADCRLEAGIAAWRVSRVALWNPRVPFGIPQVARLCPDEAHPSIRMST